MADKQKQEALPVASDEEVAGGVLFLLAAKGVPAPMAGWLVDRGLRLVNGAIDLVEARADLARAQALAALAEAAHAIGGEEGMDEAAAEIHKEIRSRLAQDGDAEE